MSATCDRAAQAVTRSLGFDCRDVSPVVSFRNPAALASWTQPVLEVLVIGGAAFALCHAVRRYRREGDATNLALWVGSLVYLAVVEPPLYFPEWFGLDRAYGFIFAHNRFTVQLMFDRLPLYIVAFYPAMTALAYEVVRSLRVFARRGPLVGAVCVAFVAQVFYEVFDQLGPQLRWWAWNGANQKVNHPMLASVPLNSMVLFASVSLAFLTYLVVRLDRLSLVLRAMVAGALTPLGMAVAGVPSGALQGHPAAQAWVLGVELGLVWAVGGWLLVRSAGSASLNPFVAVFPALFLAVHAVFWLGPKPADTPAGSGWYVVSCFCAATAVLALLYRRPTHEEVAA